MQFSSTLPSLLLLSTHQLNVIYYQASNQRKANSLTGTSWEDLRLCLHPAIRSILPKVAILHNHSNQDSSDHRCHRNDLRRRRRNKKTSLSWNAPLRSDTPPLSHFVFLLDYTYPSFTLLCYLSRMLPSNRGSPCFFLLFRRSSIEAGTRRFSLLLHFLADLRELEGE